MALLVGSIRFANVVVSATFTFGDAFLAGYQPLIPASAGRGGLGAPLLIGAVAAPLPGRPHRRPLAHHRAPDGVRAGFGQPVPRVSLVRRRGFEPPRGCPH